MPGGRRVAVGYDGRLTSPELEAALVEGLATEGADIVRIGRGPTPMLYYAAATLGVDGGDHGDGIAQPARPQRLQIRLSGQAVLRRAIQKLGERPGGSGVRRARGRAESTRPRRICRQLARDYNGDATADRRWDRERRHREVVQH